MKTTRKPIGRRDAHGQPRSGWGAAGPEAAGPVRRAIYYSDPDPVAE